MLEWGKTIPSYTLITVSKVSSYHFFLMIIHYGIILSQLNYSVLSGDKQGALEFFKLILRALCLCWDRQTQDLHVDWILFRGRSLIPVLCEVVNDNIDGNYPSSHYPIFAEFMLPRSVRLLEPPPTQEENPVAVWFEVNHFAPLPRCSFQLNTKSIDYHSLIPVRI